MRRAFECGGAVGILAGTSGDPVVTSSADSGTSGGAPAFRSRRGWLVGWAVISIIILIQTSVNAISLRHDDPHLAIWKPFLWEYTSAACAIPLSAVVGLLLQRWPPGQGRWVRFAAVNAAGAALFSLAHTLGFTGLRMLLYPLFGAERYSAIDLGYEFPKDVVSYLAWLAVFWFAGRALEAPTAEAATTAGGDAMTIRDGNRTLRVRPSEILAVASAGNYVEFHLQDGRRPLMRTTLSAVETRLSSAGFVRTHRSWLINPARVREIVPEGSGDFLLTLDEGVEAPLSRRYRPALKALGRDAA